MIFLTPSRLKLAEQCFTTRAAVIPDGTPYERVLEPEFWGHCNQLQALDIVRIIPEDGSYYAEVMVVTVARGFARVRELRFVSFEDEPASAETEEAAYAKWAGPHLKWTVVRKSDGVRLKDGLPTRGDADREAREYALVTA